MQERHLEEVEKPPEKVEDDFLSGSLDDLETELGHARARVRRFALCMDATSSMTRYWSEATEALTYIAENIFDRSRVPVELQIIAYRDHCDGSAIIEKSFYSSDRDYLKNYIRGIRSHGGGDTPEAVSIGLHEVLKEAKNLSRVILLGDAPDHHSQHEGDACVQAKVLGSKTAPVFAIYLDDCAKESFTKIAKLSGGRAYGFKDFKGGMADIITTLLAQDEMLGITYVPKTIEGQRIKEDLSK